MAALKILTIPNPKLKHKSIEVKNFDSNLKKIVKDMYDTLYSSGNGIGLAAPQVGIKMRIIVIDLKEDGKSNPITIINPNIINLSEEKFVNEEGCLSVPEYYAEVERSKFIEVEWFNENEEKERKKIDGLLSICIQHEIDHLNGILFIDHLSKLKRKLVFDKLNKIKKKNERLSKD